MKTDNQQLFEFSLVMIGQEEFTLEEVSVDFRRMDHPEDAISEYEQRFIDNNQPIYRAIWRKNG
jgi:tRNA (guanine-N7-)-methyltransferase